MGRAITDRIIRRSELAETLGVSKVTVWRMARRGELPRPLQISANVVGWRQSTVEKWLDAREAEARGGG